MCELRHIRRRSIRNGRDIADLLGKKGRKSKATSCVPLSQEP